MIIDNTNFAVFILSHGRPNKITTIKTLYRAGYKGNIYIIIDNEDPTEEEYFQLYPGRVIQFHKENVPYFDIGDCLKKAESTVVYARNACWNIAKNLGIRYFWMLDDDYNSFSYRYSFDAKHLSVIEIKQLNRVIEAMIDFLNSNDRLKSIAFMQGGELFGGVNNPMLRKIKRKVMNTFFCDICKPFIFPGRINEDVNAYVCGGICGDLFLTVRELCVTQEQTQKRASGMTDIYLRYGTYLKSFYSVMFAPACVKINQIGTIDKRIHHKIDWDITCPKIISDKYQKTRKYIDISILNEVLNDEQ